MSEESDMEKTEPASQQRIDKAREQGDVPRSRELATCLVLLAAGGGLYVSGANMLRQLKAALASGLTFDRGQAFDFSLLLSRLGSHLGDLLLAFAPLAGILILVALASPLLIGGWLFSAQALAPNFSRMNPFSGLLKIVSLNALVELGKAVAKAIIVGSIAYLVMASEINEVLGLMVEQPEAGSMHLSRLKETSS